MKKNAIIIIIIMLIYLLLMYVFIGKKNLDEQDTYRYLVIDYNTKFKYNNFKWSSFDDMNEINSTKYRVYQGKKIFGDYNLLFNDKWYLFDDNNNSIRFEDELFAYRGDDKIKFIDYNIEDIDVTDSDIINEAIKQINIDNYDGFVSGKKIKLDYDGDRHEEKFYIIEGKTDSKVFAVAFFYDKDKISIIDSDILTNQEELLLKIYNFHSIIDIGLDNKYEVIISQSTFSEHIPYCHYMIYKGRGVSTVTSCEMRVK